MSPMYPEYINCGRPIWASQRLGTLFNGIIEAGEEYQGAEQMLGQNRLKNSGQNRDVF